MQKKLIQASILASAIALSMPAFAAKDQGPGACQGNCPTGGNGPITSTGGNSNATGIGVGIGMGGQGGSGGAGGQGGQGGNSQSHATGGQGGIGLGGHGGSVVGSGNSSNKNSNENVNLNAQGQGQKQNQGQKQSSFNSNDSVAYGSVATTANSVQVEGDSTTYQAARIPVATAYAPNIAPTAVCMGSSSVGGQGMSFGFSLGSSWTDANCMLLEQVRTVSIVLGQKEVAQEMMMAVPAYAEAVSRLKGQAKKSTAAQEYAPQAVQAKVEYTDPIVRARLNLPPLK